MIKRILILFLISIVALFSTYALSGEMIATADRDILEQMANSRGLDISGSDEDVRKRLYEYLGLEEVTVKLEETKDGGDYRLEILGADNLEDRGGCFVLEGNVSISFSYSDQSPKILTSSSVILDNENKMITALGTVVYTDKDKDAPIQEIKADVFTLLWEKGDFYISGGTTETKRKNSEGDSVSFYTSGETLSYLSEGAILYDKGYITSNPVHAYSSISADRIAILPGQDMFLSSALFNIGRVPVFWFPFFFFPGSRILGNPSFGFSSSKGAFLNTTFELFGSYPGIEEVDESSSFSAILKSTDDQSSFVPKGYYYGENEDDQSTVAAWFNETKSYLALLADSYSGSNNTSLPKGGLHLALDGSVNLFDNKLKIKFLEALAYSAPVDGKNEKFRYYGENSMELSAFGFKVKASFPYYSDQYVLRDFSSRLTGFSISPLLGEETNLPKDKSSISSFSRSLNGSWSLPSKYTNSYLSNLSLSNFTIKETFSLDSSSKAFYRSAVTLPSLSFKLSGNLLSLSGEIESKKSENKEEENKVEEVEKDPLLGEKYIFATSIEKKVSTSLRNTLKLDWSFTGDIDNNKRYSKDRESGSESSYVYGGKILLKGEIGKYISLDNTFTPSYSNKNTTNIYSTYTSSVTKENISLNDNITVSIPFLSLTYKLSLKLYSLDSSIDQRLTNTGDNSENLKNDEIVFSWDKDSVKSHELLFSKTFDTSIGKLGGKVKLVLPPLSWSIEPTFSYSYSGFSSSFSWKFKEKENQLKPEKSDLILSYNFGASSVSIESIYGFDSFNQGFEKNKLRLLGTIKLMTTDKKWSIEEKVDYTPENTSGYENWFNSISTSFKADAFSGSLLYSSVGENKIELDKVTLKSEAKSGSIQFWKGRVYLSLSLLTSLNYLDRDKNRSYFTLEPAIKFSIAEFLDFNLSFTTENRNFGAFFVGDKFSFSSLWKEILSSVDFIGDGRNNTSFILRSISLEAVHVMEDWNFNCKYSTEIVKSSVTGGTVYTLQPSLSIFLSWKTMPDLKVEENWKQVADSNGNLVWEKQ